MLAGGSSGAQSGASSQLEGDELGRAHIRTAWNANEEHPRAKVIRRVARKYADVSGTISVEELEARFRVLLPFQYAPRHGLQFVVGKPDLTGRADTLATFREDLLEAYLTGAAEEMVTV